MVNYWCFRSSIRKFPFISPLSLSDYTKVLHCFTNKYLHFQNVLLQHQSQWWGSETSPEVNLHLDPLQSKKVMSSSKGCWSPGDVSANPCPSWEEMKETAKQNSRTTIALSYHLSCLHKSTGEAPNWHSENVRASVVEVSSVLIKQPQWGRLSGRFSGHSDAAFWPARWQPCWLKLGQHAPGHGLRAEPFPWTFSEVWADHNWKCNELVESFHTCSVHCLILKATESQLCLQLMRYETDSQHWQGSVLRGNTCALPMWNLPLFELGHSSDCDSDGRLICVIS